MKCAWTKKDKEVTAPYITKISRRFNQVSISCILFILTYLKLNPKSSSTIGKNLPFHLYIVLEISYVLLSPRFIFLPFFLLIFLPY